MVLIKLILKCCVFILLCGCANLNDTGTSQSIEVAAENTNTAEVIGKGDVKIGVIFPNSAKPEEAEKIADYLSGAQHALETLGNDQVSLVIRRTNGSEANTVEAVNSLLQQDTRVIVGTTNSINAAAAVKTAGVPVLAFVSNELSPVMGGFSFIDDTISGLSEAAKATIGTGRTSLSILKPSSLPPASVTRLSNQIKRHGGTLSSVIDISGANYNQVASQNRQQLNASDGFVILGDETFTESLLTRLKQDKLLKPKAILVGSDTISTRSQSLDVFENVVFARPSFQSDSSTALSYAKRFNRPMTLSAAYGFDAIAIFIGLARAGELGNDPKEALGNKRGFTALTGLFRFNDQGHIERRHQIFHVVNKKPTLLQDRGSGF